MSEEFIEDIDITPRPTVNFDGALELDRDKKPDKVQIELKLPSIWSLYWRSAIWILLFGDLSSYLLLRIISKTNMLLKWLSPISYGVLALLFLTISILYKTNKIKPLLDDRLRINTSWWCKLNLIIMLFCIVAAAMSGVIAYALPFHTAFEFNRLISLLILLAPGVAAAYVISLMKRTNTSIKTIPTLSKP